MNFDRYVTRQEIVHTVRKRVDLDIRRKLLLDKKADILKEIEACDKEMEILEEKLKALQGVVLNYDID